MLKAVLRLTILLCAIALLTDHACAQRSGGGMRGSNGGGGRGGGGGPGRFGGGGFDGGGGRTAGGGNGGGNGGGMCAGRNGTGSTTTGTQTTASASGSFFNAAGNSNSANRVASNQGQSFQSFQNNVASIQERPTASRFVQAAFQFDGDGDKELNEEELTQVATAVISELQARQPTRPHPSAGHNTGSGNHRPPRGATPQNPTVPEMTAAFVTKALKYDRDANGTLNAAETRALATAFIRTLG